MKTTNTVRQEIKIIRAEMNTIMVRKIVNEYNSEEEMEKLKQSEIEESIIENEVMDIDSIPTLRSSILWKMLKKWIIKI